MDALTGHILDNIDETRDHYGKCCCFFPPKNALLLLLLIINLLQTYVSLIQKKVKTTNKAIKLPSIILLHQTDFPSLRYLTAMPALSNLLPIC